MIFKTGSTDFARALALITISMVVVVQPVLAAKNKDVNKKEAEAVVDVYPFKSKQHGQVIDHGHVQPAAVQKKSYSVSDSEKIKASRTHKRETVNAARKSKKRNDDGDENSLSISNKKNQKSKSRVMAKRSNDGEKEKAVVMAKGLDKKQGSVVIVPAEKFQAMLKKNSSESKSIEIINVPVVPAHLIGQNGGAQQAVKAVPVPVQIASVTVPVVKNTSTISAPSFSKNNYLALPTSELKKDTQKESDAKADSSFAPDSLSVAEQMAKDIAEEEAEQNAKMKKNQTAQPALTVIAPVSLSVAKTPPVINVPKQAPTVELPETVVDVDNAANLKPKGGTKALAGTSIALLPTFIVAIDPGHGGDDSGAIGPGHVREKDVTLAIGKKLAEVLEKNGMKPVLTRSTDVFLELRSRMDVAREAHANLFVSIHANSAPHPGAKGTAVYVLSDHGVMTEQARWLSRKENSADFVGGLSLKQRDPEVAQVLLDISQSATLEASFALANSVLKHVGGFNYLEKRAPQQAGFMVLKAPDIPSILVETDFINSESGADMLSSKAFQEKMANSVGMAIKDYRDKYAPIQQKAPKLYTASNKSGA